MKALLYVEVDLEYCSLTYGTSPCAASIGVTGEAKCFNSRKTCQDAENFAGETVTLRFGVASSYLPRDIECIPALKSVTINPGTISLGENLGQRATVECVFEDFRHSDTGSGFDKYYAERGYDPFKRGTFWGKFRARHPYLQGVALRVIRGFVGQTLEEMSTHHFVVERFNGPTPEGLFAIIGKDVLKLADNDRAQCPRLSNGSLSSGIASGDNSLTLTPAGIGEEYDGDGYVNIGGREICYYSRAAGVDGKTTLCLQGSGSGTTISDDSSNALAHAYNSGAAISATVITSGNSILFDGVDDYFHYAAEAGFEFGTGDFTVEFQIRPVTTSVRHTVIDFGPLQDSSFEYAENEHYLALVVNADNTVGVEVDGVQVLTSSSTVSAGLTWHVAVTRKNSIMRLYFYGDKEDQMYSFHNFVVAEDRPVFGTDGATLTEKANYHLDGVRISKGVARWSVDSYTVPGNFSTSSSAGDTLALVRAQYSTSAVAHTASDRVQECAYFTNEDPANILFTLLNKYAGIEGAFLPVSTWSAETATYLSQVYNALIADPVGVNKLVSELIEQSALMMWWDDTTQQVRMQVLREVPSSSDVVDPDNRLAGTFSVTDQPEKRLSQVWTYFGLINPLAAVDEPKNYRSALATVDLERETLYGSPAIKKIFSRWIAFLGSSVAERLNEMLLSRFKDPPRMLSFELMRGAGIDPQLAGTFLVESPFIQDETGAGAQVPVQVIRLNSAADRFQLECEEILGGIEAANLTDRVITVQSVAADLNLRTAHDSVYPVITDPTGITVTFVIDAAATVYGSTIGTPAITVGSWPVGTDLTLIIRGNVYGAGGDGAGQGRLNGQDGGDALYTRVPIDVELEPGSRLWGGGAGGGRTRTVIQDQETGSVYQVVTPGGGGASGQRPGSKGSVLDTWAYAIQTVTATNGGYSALSGGRGSQHKFTEFSGEFTNGGDGGNTGSDGQNGTDTFGASVFFRGAGNRYRYEVDNSNGGDAGASINGSSYATLTDNGGDRRGPLTN